MSSFPSPTLIGSVRPSTTSPTPYSLSRILSLLRPTTPPSSITPSSMRMSLTPPHLTLTLILTLTPLFRPQYRREQRVYPPLPSLRSARALPPIPSRRPVPYPSPDTLGRSSCSRRLQRLHHPPLSNPTMYVEGGTRGLQRDVLSYILSTQKPTGGETVESLPHFPTHRKTL